MKAFLLVVAVALAVPASAGAKEIEKLVVCGAAGCETVAHPDHAVADGGSGGGRIPPPGSYYSVELFVGDGRGAHDSWKLYYAPEAGMISYRGEPGTFVWSRPAPAAAAVYRRATAKLAPFPAPRFESILIGGRAVADPESYLRLLTVQTAGTAYPDRADWQRVELRANRQNPWSLSKLEYSPGADVLVRGWEFVQLRPALAERVEARGSLGSTPTSGFDWPLVSGSLLAAAAFALAAIALLRRGRAPRPGTA